MDWHVSSLTATVGELPHLSLQSCLSFSVLVRFVFGASNPRHIDCAWEMKRTRRDNDWSAIQSFHGRQPQYSTYSPKMYPLKSPRNSPWTLEIGEVGDCGLPPLLCCFASFDSKVTSLQPFPSSHAFTTAHLDESILRVFDVHANYSC